MNLEEKEGNPTDVTLDKIAKDLLLFFNEFDYFHKCKRTIEKKCDIKKEHKHTCWPEDDIKRAWEETKKMDIKSSRRKHWARIIILQVVKSFVCDTCKQNPTELGCETRPNPEDRSSESKAEPERVGAVGGVEQTLGEGENISIVSKRTASSTDVAPSTTEVNPDNSENKNDAMVNEDRDTLVNICQQQKKKVQLNVADVNDKENIQRENGLRSTCGTAQSMKGNSGDIPSQSNAEPETQGAAGGAQQISGGHHQTYSYHRQTVQIRNLWLIKEFRDWIYLLEKRVDKTIYIRIPLSEIAKDEQTDSNEVPNVISPFKLINRTLTERTTSDIKKRKSYAMSFDNYTNNAEWVYEILNKNTLVNNCKEGTFGHGYDRGHLAAAANHKWCWKAYYDTYLYSNMIPQNHLLNRGDWKTLEERCRSMLKNPLIRNVHVYTGPLYLQPMDFSELGGKEVPSHFFKVIIAENKDRTVREPICYLMPNKEPTRNLENYRVNIEKIEYISGLQFLEGGPFLREEDTKIRLYEENLNQTQQHADIEVCISI